MIGEIVILQLPIDVRQGFPAEERENLRGFACHDAVKRSLYFQRKYEFTLQFEDDRSHVTVFFST